MTRALLVLALVGCGGGAKTLRLPTFTPTVEQRTLVEERATSTYELHLDDSVAVSKTIQHRRSHRRVMEVQGRLVTKVAVRYELDESTLRDADGAETRSQGPLAGKSYEVWRANDALEAVHADGSPITAVERAELAKAFGSMGTTSRWEAFLTQREWTRDHGVEPPQDALEEFPLREGDELGSATISFTGFDGGAATFRAAYAYTLADGFDVRLTSQLRADRATGTELGHTWTATISGTVQRFPFLNTIESTTTYEAE